MDVEEVCELDPSLQRLGRLRTGAGGASWIDLHPHGGSREARGSTRPPRPSARAPQAPGLGGLVPLDQVQREPELLQRAIRLLLEDGVPGAADAWPRPHDNPPGRAPPGGPEAKLRRARRGEALTPAVLHRRRGAVNPPLLRAFLPCEVAVAETGAVASKRRWRRIRRDFSSWRFRFFSIIATCPATFSQATALTFRAPPTPSPARGSRSPANRAGALRSHPSPRPAPAPAASSPRGAPPPPVGARSTGHRGNRRLPRIEPRLFLPGRATPRSDRVGPRGT